MTKNSLKLILFIGVLFVFALLFLSGCKNEKHISGKPIVEFIELNSEQISTLHKEFKYVVHSTDLHSNSILIFTNKLYSIGDTLNK